MSATASTDGGGGASRAFRYLLTFIMLLSGTANTISKSVQNRSISEGIDGTPKHFKSAFFQSFCMFWGEFSCLAFYHIQQYMKRKSMYGISGELAPDADYRALIPSGELPDVVHEEILGRKKRAPIWLFLLPAWCDIAGTTLGGIGLLYVEASQWQMLRGSLILFTAAASVIFLGQKKLPFHWFGLAIVISGLTIVGLSSILASDHGKTAHSPHQTAIGMILVIAGQVCSAAQMVIEETFLKKRSVPPLRAVGLEGFWGVIMMATIVLPAVYFIPGHAYKGGYENALDACVMLSNNWALLLYMLIYVMSIAFYNFSGLSVAKYLTSVHRTLIDAIRTVFVWTVSLFIHYVIDKRFGEEWSKYSFIQLGGFALLFLGTLIYNKVIIVPGFRYSTEVEKLSIDEGSINKNASINDAEIVSSRGADSRYYKLKDSSK